MPTESITAPSLHVAVCCQCGEAKGHGPRPPETGSRSTTPTGFLGAGDKTKLPSLRGIRADKRARPSAQPVLGASGRCPSPLWRSGVPLPLSAWVPPAGGGSYRGVPSLSWGCPRDPGTHPPTLWPAGSTSLGLGNPKRRHPSGDGG